MQKSFFVYLILAAAGIFISNELITIGIEAEFPPPDGEPKTCSDSGEVFSCAKTADSPLSKIGGVSIAALGMGFYMAVLGVIALVRFFPDQFTKLYDVIFLGSLLSVIYSLFLGIASIVGYGQICPFCAGLYGVNTLLFITAIFSHPDGRLAGFSGIPKVFASSGFLVTVVLLAATSFAAHQIQSSRYTAAETIAGNKNAEVMANAEKTPGLTVGDTPSRGAEGQSDPVIIVEWADFRCGHCGALAETLKEALKREPQAFRYHFRHFPLDKTCNPTWSEDVAADNSCLAAYAMVCADKQGQAWAMHDRIFDNQMGLQNQAPNEAGPMLRAIAQDIGLDMDRYDTCLTKADTKNTVQLDIDAAREVGIRGTPLWFMNGVRQSNEVTAGIVLRLSKVARERAEKEAADKEKTSTPKE